AGHEQQQVSVRRLGLNLLVGQRRRRLWTKRRDIQFSSWRRQRRFHGWTRHLSQRANRPRGAEAPGDGQRKSADSRRRGVLSGRQQGPEDKRPMLALQRMRKVILFCSAVLVLGC